MRDEQEQLDFPGQLADAISQAYTHRPAIPAAVDAAIVNTARVEFGRRRRMRLVVRIGGGVAAALAASVVLMILLRPTPAPKTLVKGDLDGSGMVDMVDVMLLAKRLRAGEKLDSKFDITGEGRVDQADADALAAAAVKLAPPKTAGLPTMQELGITRIARAGAMPTHAAIAVDTHASAIGVGGHADGGVTRACPPEPTTLPSKADHLAARVGMAPGIHISEARQ